MKTLNKLTKVSVTQPWDLFDYSVKLLSHKLFAVGILKTIYVFFHVLALAFFTFMYLVCALLSPG